MKVGILFDETLPKKNPGMNSSLEANNGGMCPVIYDDFDEDDPEMKPMALTCGHEFSAIAWKEDL